MTIVDDYADLILLVDRYEACTRELNKRFQESLLSDLRKYWSTLKAARGGRTPFIRDEKQRLIWQSLLREVDRGDEVFRAAAAPSPALALAETFLQQHPHLTRDELGHLAALYEIQATSPPNIGKQLIGLALAAGAFAAQSVPEEAFEHMDWSGYPAHAYPLSSARLGTCRGLTSLAASSSSSTGSPMTRRVAST